MDLFAEILISLLFEAPAEAIMESRRIKTWVKTTLFLVLGLSLSVLFGFLTWSVSLQGDNVWGTVATGLICAVWTVFVICSAVKGHKRKWKKE
jgi:membrane protein YdbS with pleckstrin-like domain